MITGVILNPDQIEDWWLTLVPLIDKPLEQSHSSKRYPLEYVKEQLCKGICQAWVIYRGISNKIVAVLVTQFRTYPGPKGKFMDLFLVGGWKMDEWFPLVWPQLKAFAKREGCSEIQGGGRLGWMRYMRKFEPEADIQSYITVNL